MTDRYILQITAGHSYHDSHQFQFPVNTPQPVKIKTEKAEVELNVRIQNYNGLPRDSPSTSPYFETEPHAYNQDQYSFSIRFKPLRPDGDESPGIKASDLQFGNDFDHPIRDRLPPGFNTAMSIVKWWIDPGLEGDAYADEPYLYGPALSSFNVIHVGEGEYDEAKGGLWFEEGGDEAGVKFRSETGAPAAGKARMKWALKTDSKEKWVFEYGRTYGLDFFNPYLDFANLALKLPGFSLPIIKFWDGQGLRALRRRSHRLRYVLRNRTTGETYLVIMITLYHKDFVNEDGTLKPGAKASLTGRRKDLEADEEEVVYDETQMLKLASERFGPKYGEKGYAQTSLADVD